MTRLTTRLKHVESLRGTPSSFDGKAFAAHLHQLLTSHVLNLTGDTNRDIVRVDVFVDNSGSLPMYGFEGEAATGLCRLWCAFEEHPTGPKVMLVATKGTTKATFLEFGESGANYGNSILIARLLDLAIEAAVAHATTIENDPCDHRVEAHYTAMGFERGRTLDLTNSSSIRTALAFIDDVYQVWLHNGSQFRDPWT